MVEMTENFSNNSNSDKWDMEAHIIHDFKGGSLNTYLNRSHIYQNPSNHNQLSVFAGDESTKSVTFLNQENFFSDLFF